MIIKEIYLLHLFWNILFINMENMAFYLKKIYYFILYLLFLYFFDHFIDYYAQNMDNDPDPENISHGKFIGIKKDLEKNQWISLIHLSNIFLPLKYPDFL